MIQPRASVLKTQDREVKEILPRPFTLFPVCFIHFVVTISQPRLAYFSFGKGTLYLVFSPPYFL